jgi:hypothetical protein
VIVTNNINNDDRDQLERILNWRRPTMSNANTVLLIAASADIGAVYANRWGAVAIVGELADRLQIAGDDLVERCSFGTGETASTQWQVLPHSCCPSSAEDRRGVAWIANPRQSRR